MAKQVVPKKIAGVPVPDAVRQSSAVKSLLGSPLGKKLLADAMLAAAGAAAAVLLKRRSGQAKDKDLSKEVLRAAAGAVTVGLGRAALSSLGPGEGVQLAVADTRGGRAKKAAGRKSARKGAAKKSTAKKKTARKTKRAS
jgi:hypothetical protein